MQNATNNTIITLLTIMELLKTFKCLLFIFELLIDEQTPTTYRTCSEEHIEIFRELQTSSWNLKFKNYVFLFSIVESSETALTWHVMRNRSQLQFKTTLFKMIYCRPDYNSYQASFKIPYRESRECNLHLCFRNISFEEIFPLHEGPHIVLEERSRNPHTCGILK